MMLQQKPLLVWWTLTDSCPSGSAPSLQRSHKSTSAVVHWVGKVIIISYLEIALLSKNDFSSLTQCQAIKWNVLTIFISHDPLLFCLPPWNVRRHSPLFKSILTAIIIIDEAAPSAFLLDWVGPHFFFALLKKLAIISFYGFACSLFIRRHPHSTRLRQADLAKGCYPSMVQFRPAESHGTTLIQGRGVFHQIRYEPGKKW